MFALSVRRQQRKGEKDGRKQPAGGEEERKDGEEQTGRGGDERKPKDAGETADRVMFSTQSGSSSLLQPALCS